MYKLLLVEDSLEDIDVCKTSIKKMNNEAEADEDIYELVSAPSYEKALEELKNSFDAIIIDIKLAGELSGNDLIKTIINQFRIPVAVMTGTPDTDLEDGSPIQVYKKGETSYQEIINDLEVASQTGLFDVFGRVGFIEEALNKIFWEYLYPQIKLWQQRKENGVDTKKILLRYALFHVQELIDSEVLPYFTEEMYIKPPLNKDIRTGTIFQSVSDNMLSIVLSPPCDLAVHNGQIKTDSILLCEIEDNDIIYKENTDKNLNHGQKKANMQKAIRNNYNDYYHWLPSNSLFCGGFINFRKIHTCPQSDFNEKYGEPILKIQENFVRNILNRFSAYYARPGQPDFNFKVEEKAMIDKFPPNP